MPVSPRILWPAILLASLLLTGCVSSRLSPDDLPSRDAPVSWAAHSVAHALRSAVASWEGVPYVWGGTSRRGIDCSGFVQTVYRDVFATSLPRTTQAQSRVGAAVAPPRLRSGDLLFFRPRRGRWHAGIYLADGQFVHASTTKGVTVSSLRSSYWRDRWSHARRVLPPLRPASEPPSAPASRRSSTAW